MQKRYPTYIASERSNILVLNIYSTTFYERVVLFELFSYVIKILILQNKFKQCQNNLKK